MHVQVLVGNKIIKESKDENEVNFKDLQEVKKDLDLCEKIPNEIAEQILEDLTYDYVDLYKTIEQEKDIYIEEYYTLAPYFNEKNMVSLISKNIDEIVFPNGIIGGQLYVVTAPSGKGKTSFCMMLTTCNALGTNPYYEGDKQGQQRKIIYVSLEQSKEEIVGRIISTISSLNNLETAITFGELMNFFTLNNRKDLIVAVQIFKKFKKNVRVLDATDFQGDFSIHNISSIVRSNNALLEADLIIIDQYENIEGVDQFLSEIAIELKALARDLDIPVIVQAQVNKSAIASATNSDGTINSAKITGNSLKGSSSLEHQASGIIALTPTGVRGTFKNHEAIQCKITMPKSRHGSNADCIIWHVGGYNLFVDHIDEKKDKQHQVVNLND